MTVAATYSASPGVAGQRRAILAISSGLTGLTASKALKFSQVNITDALVFVARIAAQSISRLWGQASQWTTFVPAVVTASVLFALAVAAAVHIVELIAAPPSSGWSGLERPDGRFQLSPNVLRRSQSITKGWFRL